LHSPWKDAKQRGHFSLEKPRAYKDTSGFYFDCEKKPYFKDKQKQKYQPKWPPKWRKTREAERFQYPRSFKQSKREQALMNGEARYIEKKKACLEVTADSGEVYAQEFTSSPYSSSTYLQPANVFLLNNAP